MSIIEDANTQHILYSHANCNIKKKKKCYYATHIPNILADLKDHLTKEKGRK